MLVAYMLRRAAEGLGSLSERRAVRGLTLRDRTLRWMRLLAAREVAARSTTWRIGIGDIGVGVGGGEGRGTSEEGEEIVATGAMGAVMGGVRNTEEEATMGRGTEGKGVAMFVLIRPPEACGKALHQATLRLDRRIGYMAEGALTITSKAMLVLGSHGKSIDV
jgi:hypothetical protein